MGAFFEVDTADLFSMKESLLADTPLQCASRRTVIGRLGAGFDLRAALAAQGFDPTRSSVWLLEGLVMYLSEPDVVKVLNEIGSLAAAGSGIWLDGFSRASVQAGIVFHGVPFESGLDNYDEVLLQSGFKYAGMYESGSVNMYGERFEWGAARRLRPQDLMRRKACLAVKAYM